MLKQDNFKTENLLQKVGTIVKHSQELSKLNGENFNLFSILNMERQENATHSRFVAELLNPNGTHEMGDVFLDIFINHLSKKINNNFLENFILKNSCVTVEKFIGTRNDEEKIGGRIDIAVSDIKGLNIFIENKIYAGDQNAQIERYCNFQKANSIVLYLTLFGEEPTEKSRGLLNNGNDFYCISYKEDIKHWLEKCQKEASEKPLLRESIKQYIILIKKLTNQLSNNKMEAEVIDLLKNNLEAGNTIFNHFLKAKLSICDEIKNGVFNRLKTHIEKEGFHIWLGNDIYQKFSQIWIEHNEFKSQSFLIGLEAFNGNGNGDSNFKNKMFIGIFDNSNRHKSLYCKDDTRIAGWWYDKSGFDNFEGFEIDMSDLKFLQFLVLNPNKKEELIKLITAKSLEYIHQQKEHYLKVCQIASAN